jgi:CHAT domain-containing protein
VNVLENAGRLFIVPHKQLHYLPFAALWFQDADDRQERLYFCERFQSTLVPSASYLLHLATLDRGAMHTAPALVLGDPTQDLPAGASEAKAVSTLLKTEPLLGRQATRAQVLARSDELSVLHIASHGIYDTADPLLSGVVLADGRLSVEDLLEARIRAELLTLSGCMTGVSRQTPGDELTGLSRAALAAGVPSVITTLWEVVDDSSRAFFEQFYGYLCTGMNKDEGLARTQCDMMADPRYASPENWAPYVLIGDCR